jgi:hypothetical protein
MEAPAVDDKVLEAWMEVRKARIMESETAQLLANVRADLGEALVDLEAACNPLGLKRSDLLDALEEDAADYELESLDDEGIRNHKRMARLRRDHPDYAHFLLKLGVSQQKSMSLLSDERIGEFVTCGIPLEGGGSVPLLEATKVQVQDAARAAWKTDPGKKVEIPKPEVPKPSPDARVVKAKKAFRELPRLTLDQAEDFLLMLLARLVFDPTITSRTTRRMIEATFEVGFGKDKVPVMQMMDVLQALPQYLANVNFQNLTPDEAQARACHLIMPTMAALAEWCHPARAEAG